MRLKGGKEDRHARHGIAQTAGLPSRAQQLRFLLKASQSTVQAFRRRSQVQKNLKSWLFVQSPSTIKKRSRS